MMKVQENIFFNEFSSGDLYLPSSVKNCDIAVLLIHGGGWTDMDKQDVQGIAEFLCGELSLRVFNINYRMNRQASWPGCGDDCLAAAEFLLNGNIRECLCRKLLIIGPSAGGHLALMTGLRLPEQKVAGIVSISGIADIEADFSAHPERYKCLSGSENPSEKDLRPASPSDYLTASAPPILCTHDNDDNVVPVSSSCNFVKKAKACGMNVRLYTYRKPENGYSHRIWIPGSDPHKLYRDIEEEISGFIAEIISDTEK